MFRFKHKIPLLLTLLMAMNVHTNAQYEQVGWVSKFGLAGGFTPGFTFPEINYLNDELINLGFGETLSNNIFTLGGGGYVYVLFVKNLRLGGMGYSGSSSVSTFNEGFRKEVRYSIGGGGLTIEYTLPFVKRIAISLGAIIGAGSIEVEVFQNKDDFYWDNLWNEFSDTSNSTKNISRRLSNSYFTLSPTLNVDIPINRFIAFRIGGGYQFTFGREWKVENDQTLFNSPSGLNGNAFFIQTGIFLGFFAF